MNSDCKNSIEYLSKLASQITEKTALVNNLKSKLFEIDTLDKLNYFKEEIGYNLSEVVDDLSQTKQAISTTITLLNDYSERLLVSNSNNIKSEFFYEKNKSSIINTVSLLTEPTVKLQLNGEKEDFLNISKK